MGLLADMQSMFLQVRVEPRDCDALRFLWWPGENLSADLTEFRMVKNFFSGHIFTERCETLFKENS